MIDECVTLLVDAAGRVPFPGGFCVTGEGGTGKSALLEYIKRRFRRKVRTSCQSEPLLRSSCRSVRRPRGIAQMIMRRLVRSVDAKS